MEKNWSTPNGVENSVNQSSLRGPLILAKMIKDAIEKEKHVSELMIVV